jgi:hypothetical protein
MESSDYSPLSHNEHFDDTYLLEWENEENCDTTSTDSLDGSEKNSTIIAPTLKRKRNKVPRIVKNDIRRKYVLMIGNVFNNNEVGYFYSFFRTFCVDQMLFKKSCLAGYGKKDGNSNNIINRITEVRDDVVFQDINRMSCEWYLLHQLIPDEILKIEDAKILSWPGNKRNVIVIDVSCEFTRIYQVNPKRYLEILFEYYATQIAESSVTVTSDEASTSSEEDTTTSVAPVSALASEISSVIPDPFAAYFQMTGESIQVLSKPVRVKFLTEFRLLLDENKSIEMMEIGKTIYVPVNP